MLSYEENSTVITVMAEVCICVCFTLNWVHSKIFSKLGKIGSQLQKDLMEENSRKRILELVQKAYGLFR